MGTLPTLTVKYAGIANAILDNLLPIVKNLPIIPKKVTALLVNLEAITQKIIDDSQENIQNNCRCEFRLEDWRCGEA